MPAYLKPGWLPASLLVLVVLFFWRPELATLGAGVALFMMGMHHLEDGFRAFTGGALERWLGKSTNRLWKSLLFGVVSTALVQSSSLVTLLSIAFLSAGLISLVAGIGIVFGSNLGTTTGAWLIALVGLKIDLATVAMPMLVLGVIMARRTEPFWRGVGQVLLGIGLLFLGIDLMKEGFEAFEGVLDLSEYHLSGWLGVLAYTLLGLLATVLMQSSHATLMITLAALASGQLAYANALAMAIGANLGTTVTALIGALGSNNAGRRLAGAHILFNLITGAVALLILPSLTRLVDWLAELLHIAADAWTLKLALFHSLFNVLGLLLMLPLIPLMVRLLMRWLPDPQPVSGPQIEPVVLSEQPRTRAIYLNESSLLHADAALKVLSQELRHMAALSRQVVAAALYLPPGLQQGMSRELLHRHLQVAVPADQREDADSLYERHIKGVYADVVDFISHMDLSLLPEQQQALMDHNLAARDLVEAVKAAKHLQGNLRRQVDSDQPALREAYLGLREQAGQALLDMLRISDVEGDHEARSALLAEFHSQQQRFANEFQQQVQLRLRNRELDGWQATSLLNDLHYLLAVRENLLQAHMALYDGARLPLPPESDKDAEGGGSAGRREKIEPVVGV
ncbi:Na/Pi cotransporter family protein [Halopseudomonas yangmingensis]|uniref:Phosphate:Na+ symporter n=1 Tax=Halopseudomonas yangmingensis TaxID=1720063 RepID=A0A1I4U352_9GAMM|nr:Na/Pi symporter [Halopseudomonas yangmingensis]SFM83241.1 phosphate:Na+ symporter [Halopseudomonas yangmingensis]